MRRHPLSSYINLCPAATVPRTLTAPTQPEDILCDRYRVDRVLGAGGMGVVVLAEHIELRERVAIKFLLDSSAASRRQA